MKRIVCVGSRLHADDAAGPRVHDRLARRTLPPDVTLVDGGLLGLNLLPLLDGAERVVFVDQVRGFGRPGEALLLDPGEVAGQAPSYGHATGFVVLLGMLPALVGAGGPEVLLVGVEGPADDGAIERAADLGLRAACQGAAARAPRRRPEASA